MIALEAARGVSIVPVTTDYAAMLAALVERNIDHLGAYLPQVTTVSTPAAARAYLEAAAARARSGDMFEWHLFVGGDLCGSVRVKNIDTGNRKAEIGYFVGSEYAGRGIVSAAVRSVLAYCFETLHLNRMELRCAATNHASIRVAERLGFTREGMLRQDECLHGVFVDHLVYGLLSEEFRHRAGDERPRS